MGPPPPLLISATWSTYTHRQAPSALRQMLCLRIPRSKFSTFRSRSFSVFGPSASYKLPLPLRQTPTLSTFKSSHKTLFFSTSVGLSSLLTVFVRPRPCVDCRRHVTDCVLCECPRMTASERRFELFHQDSAPFKFLNYYYYYYYYYY